MTELKINLPEPEDINRQITEAIAASLIGAKLNEAVRAAVAKLSDKYNSPIHKIVEDEVAKLLYVIIRDEYQEKLKAKIREELTEEFLNKITSAALDAWTAQKKW